MARWDRHQAMTFKLTALPPYQNGTGPGAGINPRPLLSCLRRTLSGVACGAVACSWQLDPGIVVDLFMELTEERRAVAGDPGLEDAVDLVLGHVAERVGELPVRPFGGD